MYKHMGKVVTKILQCSAVTQTMLMSGGLTIHPLFANFLWCTVHMPKNYKNWLVVDKLTHSLLRITGCGS